MDCDLTAAQYSEVIMSNVYIQQTTRRGILRLIGGTIVWAGTSRLGRSAAEELPHLTDANPAAASLGPGTYNAFVCVTSNDPNNARTAVPVTLTVP